MPTSLRVWGVWTASSMSEWGLMDGELDGEEAELAVLDDEKRGDGCGDAIVRSMGEVQVIAAGAAVVNRGVRADRPYI
jgi:hypothetical protein